MKGVYFEGQQTEQGNLPSEDLMAVKVSAGTAYVKGYDIDKLGQHYRCRKTKRCFKNRKFSSSF